MPVVPADYDRRPLSACERAALAALEATRPRGTCHAAREARRTLKRLERPLAAVFRLRSAYDVAWSETRRILYGEMRQRDTVFWAWSRAEWLETMCPSTATFNTRYAVPGRECHASRSAVRDAAYLLGEVADPRLLGMTYQVTAMARAIFGADLLAAQTQRVLDALMGETSLGYSGAEAARAAVQSALSLVCLLNRSPYLEDLTADFLESVAAASADKTAYLVRRLIRALRALGLASAPPHRAPVAATAPESAGMAPDWYAWCMAWYARDVRLTPHTRQSYRGHMLSVGRWLARHHPRVTTPEGWDEDLALMYTHSVCTQTVGEYALPEERRKMASAGILGAPLKPNSISAKLKAITRFFVDLQNIPHAVGGRPARRIALRFKPQEVFATPRAIKRLLGPNPRDIDQGWWRKLTLAAAGIAADDLPRGAQYPPAYYRAVALLWVTAARRPNELARLRLDCVRREWEPGMCGEGGQPLEPLTEVCYLQVPSGKYRGPFWIWIPMYTADAIDAWKRERPRGQGKLWDEKDREAVEYLFSIRNSRMATDFLNASVIPALCAKAGVPRQDAKGNITAHRGRSARATLLRLLGVPIDALAAYLGHNDTSTIEYYVRADPRKTNRIIRQADSLSRIIEGLYDKDGAVTGQPRVVWLIGRDVDGAPRYCGNELYQLCPHRMECAECAMFIGGQKAILLQDSPTVLPIQTVAEMTPEERYRRDGDAAALARRRAELSAVPVPDAPGPASIFHPEALSARAVVPQPGVTAAEALARQRRILGELRDGLAAARQRRPGPFRAQQIQSFEREISTVAAQIAAAEACVAAQGAQRTGSDDPA